MHLSSRSFKQSEFPFHSIGHWLFCSQHQNSTLSSRYVCFMSTSHSWSLKSPVTSLAAVVQGFFMTMNMAHWCFLHDSTEPAFLHRLRRRLPSEQSSLRAFPVSYSEVKPIAIRSVPEPLYFHSARWRGLPVLIPSPHHRTAKYLIVFVTLELLHRSTTDSSMILWDGSVFPGLELEP